MEKILLHSLIVAGTLLMVGCAQGVSVTDFRTGDNGSQAGPNSPTPTPGPAPTPTPDGSITIAQLTGQWQGNCQPLGDQTIKNRLTFSGANVVADQSLVYSGSGCNGSPIVVVNMTGNYSIAGLSTTVNQATDFTISVTKVTGTPQSDFVAGQLNFIGYCGYSDWQSGVARNVSLSNPCLADLPLRGNQIARINGNVLYFGNSAKTAIDFSVGYTKF